MKKQRFRTTIYLFLTLITGLGITGPVVASDSTISSSETQMTLSSEISDTGELSDRGTAVQHLSLSDYSKLSANDLAEKVRSKEVTSEELVRLAFLQIKQENPKLNAVISTRKEQALKEAKELQDSGQPFLGVPILMKGLGHTVAGMSNSNGFKFAQHEMARSDGSVTRVLKELGFIVIGQTNYPELGFKNITDSKLYGNTGSPWNPAFQAGGSSGGSGAAVASGMTPVASGSDAGGSIRIPASWNGIVGLKPSRGMIKGSGTSAKNQVVHFPLTKNMLDTSKLFEALKNPNAVELSDDTAGKKIGYTLESPVGTPVSADAKTAVLEAVEFLKEQGFEVSEVKMPVDGKKLMESYYTIGAGSAGMAAYQLSRLEKRPLEIDDVDILTWALYHTSKLIPKEDVAKAWEFSADAAKKMAELHQTYPLILSPTTAATAPVVDDDLLTPELRSQMAEIENLPTKEERLKLIYDQWLPALTLTPFTQLANLTGEPAISLPTYVSDRGLPLGIQINGAVGSDSLLIKMGSLFEEHGKFKQLTVDETETTKPTDTTISSITRPSITTTDITNAEISESSLSTQIPETSDKMNTKSTGTTTESNDSANNSESPVVSSMDGKINSDANLGTTKTINEETSTSAHHQISTDDDEKSEKYDRNAANQSINSSSSEKEETTNTKMRNTSEKSSPNVKSDNRILPKTNEKLPVISYLFVGLPLVGAAIYGIKRKF